MSGKITLSIRITQETDEHLRARAQSTGKSLGECVEEAVRQSHYQQQAQETTIQQAAS